MNCRSCGRPFPLQGPRDANTLCPPCRKPKKPMPLEHIRYDPPGWMDPIRLDDSFWENWEPEK